MPISPELHQQAVALLKARGFATSDCLLVAVPGNPGWLELRSASGTKRLAIVVLSRDERAVDAYPAH